MTDDWLRPLSTEHSKPLGFCMYCGATGKLSNEHVIPYWMAGAYVVPKSSCDRCAKITRGFEDNLSYTSFLGFRRRMKIQSRSKQRSLGLRMLVNENGVAVEKEVSAHETPAFLVTCQFEPPGLLDGRSPWAPLLNLRFKFTYLEGKVPHHKRRDGTLRIYTDPINLMRLGAKIAHGMLYFKTEYADYEPLLNDVILTGHYAPYLVGSPKAEVDCGVPEPPESNVEVLHSFAFYQSLISDDNVYEYLILEIKLFVNFGGPVFQIVAARRERPGLNILAVHRPIAIPRSNGVEIERVPMLLHLPAINSLPILEATNLSRSESVK